MKCIGFGENKCKSRKNSIYKSEYWCDECEGIRRKTIKESLEKLCEDFESEVKKSAMGMERKRINAKAEKTAPINQSIGAEWSLFELWLRANRRAGL